VSKPIWVIYHKSSTAILSIRTARGSSTKQYYGMPAAAAALTRYCKRSGMLPTDDLYPLYTHGIAERDHYHAHIERQVERVNMMSGERYMESVNTPRCCSPSSEAYWSM